MDTSMGPRYSEGNATSFKRFTTSQQNKTGTGNKQTLHLGTYIDWKQMYFSAKRITTRYWLIMFSYEGNFSVARFREYGFEFWTFEDLCKLQPNRHGRR